MKIIIITTCLFLISFTASSIENLYNESEFNFTYTNKTYNCQLKLPLAYIVGNNPSPSNLYNRRLNFNVSSDYNERSKFLASVIKEQLKTFKQQQGQCLIALWLDAVKNSNQLRSQIFHSYTNLEILEQAYSSNSYNDEIHGLLIRAIVAKELNDVEGFLIARYVKLDNLELAFLDEIKSKKLFLNLSAEEKADLLKELRSKQFSEKPLDKYLTSFFDFSSERKEILKYIEEPYFVADEKAYEAVFSFIQFDSNADFLRSLIKNKRLSHSKLMMLTGRNKLVEVLKSKSFIADRCMLYQTIIEEIFQQDIARLETEALQTMKSVNDPCVIEKLKVYKI